MPVVFFIVSFIASVIGSVCGIGGGIIIKPTLDLLQMGSVSTISFLSGCTVLAMSGYSVSRAMLYKDSQIELRICSLLAGGAVIGGMAGNFLFTTVKGLFANPDTVGAVQAFFLALITISTLVCTVFMHRVRTRSIQSSASCVLIGMVLGILSSFLGIGGGPINLVVLFFFFSMSAKVAAQSSLYIIMFSQIASLLTTLVSGMVPPFEPIQLLVMIAGGILGGIAGRSLNKRMDDKSVKGLFIILMVVIIGISFYNVYQFAVVR